MEFKLTIELVPSTAWNKSVYQMLRDRRRLWNRIKSDVYQREGRQCFICGSKEGRLQAHEFWEYDDENNVQKLKAIHHLCDYCHKIKHIGFWCHTQRGKQLLESQGIIRQDLINHFCRVNNCSEADFLKHENEAFKTWSQRSKQDWKQDFGEYESILTISS